MAIGLVGSGSNLLVADEGFRGLAIKLDGELAAIERDGERRIVCGGGARLPSAAAKAAGWGLSGLEFGINIPGTAGGAVKMNANAYGGQLAEVLEWVDVCTAAGTDRRAPEELGFAYRQLEPRRRRGGGPGLVRALAGRSRAGQGDAGRDARAPPRGAALGDQDLRLDLQEPRRNERAAEGRTAGQLLEAAGCRGLRVGGARFSEKHANFVENEGEATTADVLELMAEGRRRVHERFGVELEPEVQHLGELSLAGGLGAVRRWIAVGGLAVAAVLAVWFFLLRTTEVEPTVIVALPTSVIGSGEDAIGVAPDGTLLVDQGPPPEGTLPQLPLAEPPKGGRLAGPMLEQARVLGAAPAPIRPCIEGSSYGESGVDVELRSGIELRFGDATRAAEKWRAAAAVLADPSITALDYVDLHSPGRPAVHGEGHTLPAAEEASGSGCGK